MRKFFTTIYLISIHILSIAQCAMCKAGAEQSLERGAQDANWLNYGIFMLMLSPFILILCLFLLVKYNHKKHPNSFEGQ